MPVTGRSNPSYTLGALIFYGLGAVGPGDTGAAATATDPILARRPLRSGLRFMACPA